MVRGADACVAVGTRSKDYLCSLGATEEQVFTGFSTVDVDLFRRISAVARVDQQKLRASFGIRRGRVILYCGQFIERKGLRYLIEAFAAVKEQLEDVALVLIGYGPMHGWLLSEVKRLGLSDVHILEHVEVTDMPRIYALADVFVLPSLQETWGLVVNEAMACGLPLIVSDKVGAGVDLVAEGMNGFVVPAVDWATIAERCLRLLRDDVLLHAFSACSLQRIELFIPSRVGGASVDAVDCANAPPAHPRAAVISAVNNPVRNMGSFLLLL